MGDLTRRVWTRSNVLTRAEVIGNLMARFLNDTCTARDLLEVLSKTAELVGVSNWKDIQQTSFIYALKTAPQGELIWKGLPFNHRRWISDCSDITIACESLYALKDARSFTIEGLQQIFDNEAKSNPPFSGLNGNTKLKDFINTGNKLEVHTSFDDKAICFKRTLPFEILDGVSKYPTESMIAILLLEILQTQGWRYLRRCANPRCKRFFTARRTNASTCSSNCRKHLSLIAQISK